MGLKKALKEIALLKEANSKQEEIIEYQKKIMKNQEKRIEIQEQMIKNLEQLLKEENEGNKS